MRFLYSGPVRHTPVHARSGIAKVWVPAVVVVTALVATVVALIVHSHDQSRAGLEQRYQLRSELASRFVTSYIVDFQTREADDATHLLVGRAVSAERFALVSRAFGFGSAVLLDAHGRALQTIPARKTLLGTRLDRKYAHLRAAVAGHPAVSNVVPSAVGGTAIVALAVPFDTPFGRRVFSGGAPIGHTPIAAFLDDALPFTGARAYLIDAGGKVIVAGGSTAQVLARPPLTQGRKGFVSVGGTRYRFASLPIARTPWRLLALAPADVLFAPISGTREWASWLAVVAFAFASAAVLVLLRRLLRHKDELDYLASRDPLTGALNRRTLERSFGALSREAGDARSAVGVLAVDIDHFKDVNDTHGHAAGDALLQRVAEILWIAVRPVDVVARIGGDEFVVLLADVTRAQVSEIAARAADALEGATVAVSDQTTIRASCSVGIAIAGFGDPLATALARADEALYKAKARRPPVIVLPAHSRRSGRTPLTTAF
jgi:diguanylate cyclase (GGDEF)-like protein